MLDEAVERHLDAIEKGAPGAIGDTKALFDQLWHHPLSDDLDAAQEVHGKMRASAEAAEGMAAFLEKRKPGWAVDS
jgi:enoyl-CoA hydratase/carnithine racemase